MRLRATTMGQTGRDLAAQSTVDGRACGRSGAVELSSGATAYQR